MSITDELRNFTKDPLLGYASQSQHIERLTAIADRIDAAHEEALGSKVTGVLLANEDGTEFLAIPASKMAEHYLELPVDADGIQIHVGDTMELDGEVREVLAVGVEIFIAWDGIVYRQYDADAWSHWHPDTWERIIEDARANSMNINGSYLWKNKTDELVARCKALAGDAE